MKRGRHGPWDPVSLQELLNRVRAGECAEAERTAREALRTAPRGGPSIAMSHAVAVAISYPYMLQEDDAKTGVGRTSLAEAIALLETVVAADDEERQAAAPLGDPAVNLAQLYRRWRGDARDQFGRDPLPPLGTESEPGVLFGRLAQETARLLSARRVNDAEALLARACAIARLWGESGAYHRASLEALRVLRAHLADRFGAAVDATRRDHKDAMSVARFAYEPQQRAEYLSLSDLLAGAAWQGSQFTLARLLAGNSLDVRRRAAEEAHDFDAYARHAIWFGEVANAAGAHDHAWLVFDEVRRLHEEGHGNPDTRRAAKAGLGAAWLGLGQPEQGRRMLREALDDPPPAERSGWYTNSLGRLYEASLDAGDHATALACHERLVETGDSRGTSRAEIEADATARTDPAAALDLYERILNPPKDRPLRASTLRRAALRAIRLLFRRGEMERAYQLLTGVYDAVATSVGSDDPSLSDLEELAAGLLCGLGRHEEALSALFTATARDTRNATQRLGLVGSSERAAILAPTRRRVEALVALVAERFAHDQRSVGGAFALGLRRKGLSTAVEQRVLRRLLDEAQENPDVAARVTTLSAARSEVARLALLNARQIAPPDVKSDQALAAAVASLRQLELEAVARMGGVGVAGLTEEPNPMSVAMTIPEDAAFVSVHGCTPLLLPGEATAAPRRYVAFTLLARSISWQLLDLGEAAEIDRLVEAFRDTVLGELPEGGDSAPSSAAAHGSSAEGERAIAPVPSGATVRGAGMALRQRLFDPLLPALGGRTRIVVASDGPLLSLPLECLPDGSGDLIDAYRFSYAISSSSLIYHQAEVIHGRSDADRAACTAPIVIGDPDYDLGKAADMNAFEPLPGTRDEATEVARLLGVQAAIGRGASRARVTAARSPLVLHLATHGYALGSEALGGALSDLPLLRAGLAFAGANHDFGGILAAQEVLSLDLRRTALAVLSACETGLGELEHGEGLASLGRVFESAGVRAVVVASWQVPDDATALLMTRFYQHLAAGTGCADALRAAKLDTRARYADVADWGGFLCFGGWGSIALDAWTRRPSADAAVQE